MVYNTQDYWDFGLCLSSGILENTFPKPDLSLSSGEGLLDPLEGVTEVNSI
jgi:hypothetical protein